MLYISLPFVCYVIGYQLYKYYLWFRLNYKLTKMRENDHELKQAISDLKNNQFFYKKETINSIIESANQDSAEITVRGNNCSLTLETSCVKERLVWSRTLISAADDVLNMYPVTEHEVIASVQAKLLDCMDELRSIQNNVRLIKYPQ